MKVKSILEKLFQLLVNLVIMMFALSCVVPLLWMLNSSLKTNGDFMADSISLAVKPYFQNYVDVFVNGKLWQYFLNSMLLSVLNVLFTVFLSFIMGYFLSRYKFRLRNTLYLLFIMGMVIPILSLLIPVFIQFNFLDLLDHRLTLLMPYIAFSMPLSVILVENYVKAIPVELDEAAYMEGSSTWNMLMKIIFPMCTPIISILVITSFINAWNEFPFSLVLIRSEHLRTISIGIRMFNSQHTVNYTLYMAALVITVLPILVIYIAFSKKIMEGMTVGAIKG